MSKKTFYLFLFLFVIIAFLVRLLILYNFLSFDTSVLQPRSTTDMETYIRLGKTFAKGEYDQVFKYQPFYYTVFIPIILKCFSFQLLPVLICQVIIGTLTVFLGALSAKILFNREAGLITAFCLTFCQTLIFYTPFFLIVTLQAFWIIFILYISLIIYKKEKVWLFGILGLALGCSILTRGNIYFLVPGFFIFATYFGIKKIKSKFNKLLPVLLLLIFIVLPQLPYIYFNTIQKGELTPPSTDAENVLIFGNTPQSLPATIDMPKIAKYWAKTKNKISIYQRIWDYFSSRPMSYLELSFRKFLLFWDSREIPNNVNLKRNLRESQIFEYIAFIPNYILLSLGISGILYFLSFLRKDRKLFILFYIVIAYWVSISCFYIVGRFRAPVFPILAVFTGGFLSRALLPPTRRNILLLLLLIISGLAITLKSYDYYRLYFQQYVMKYVRPAGTYVSMGEKKMVLDNGSFFPDSYSWKNFSPYPGMSITKYFYIKKNHFPQSYTFKLIVGFNNPGFVELEVNNKNYLLKSSEEKQKGKLVCKFNSVDIKKHKNEKLLIVKINIKRVSEGVYFYLDRRRDYNRTKINNKIIDSELVSRIIF